MEALVGHSLKRTLDLFAANNTTAWSNNPELDGKRLKIKAKLQAEYNDVKETAPPPTILQVCHRSEEHTSELQSLMRISYAVFCLKKNKRRNIQHKQRTT